MWQQNKNLPFPCLKVNQFKKTKSVFSRIQLNTENTNLFLPEYY